MKALNAGPIATLTVALSTLVCSRAAAQCPFPPADPTTPQIHNIAVTLANGTAPGSCVASNIKPGPPPTTGYKIRASNKGDTVKWTVTNNCSHTVKFTISNFTAHNGTDQIQHPLTEVFGSPLLVVDVATGGVGLVTAHTRSPLEHYGRACTWYNYTFEEIATGGKRKVIADPQIEIPN